MKRKNVISSLLFALAFGACAVVLTFLEPNDGTASVLLGFFALVAIVEAIEAIKYNRKLNRLHKNALRSVKHRYPACIDMHSYDSRQAK